MYRSVSIYQVQNEQLPERQKNFIEKYADKPSRLSQTSLVVKDVSLSYIELTTFALLLIIISVLI